MSLRDFRSDPSDLKGDAREDAIQSSLYHQEITSLKIDKLSNRVTIISVILPVLISVVLFFSYLDIQERVTDVDTTKNTQVDRLTRQFEEKLNALDVRIAKNRFDMDERLPLLEQKEQALENQVAKMASAKADSAVIEKAVAKVEAALAKIDKRIRNNASQDKATLAEIERINQALVAEAAQTADEHRKGVEKLTRQTAALKKSLDEKSSKNDALQSSLDQLKKDLSLIKLQVKSMEQALVSSKDLDRRLADLEAALVKKFTRKTSQAPKPKSNPQASQTAAVPKAPSLGTGGTPAASAISGTPQPQLNMEGVDTISQETLTQ